MKRSRLTTVLSLLLAAVIVYLGAGAVDFAERWLFPAAQPTYLPAGNTPAAVLRFESDEDLQLYPMNEYDPENCIPAKSSDVFYESYKSYHRQETGLAPGESMEITDKMYENYLFLIDGLVIDAIDRFMDVNGEYTEATVSFDRGAHLTNNLEYDEAADLFFVHDFHVSMNFWVFYYSMPYYSVPGHISLAFRSDLLTGCELVYFRFNASSPQYYAREPNATANWLFNTYFDYTDGIAQWYDNPYVHALGYIQRLYNNQRSETAAYWEYLEKNFDHILYNDEVLCIFSSGEQRVVLTYDPGVDTFVGFSIQAE